jgi:hypothetical protein
MNGPPQPFLPNKPRRVEELRPPAKFIPISPKKKLIRHFDRNVM